MARIHWIKMLLTHTVCFLTRIRIQTLRDKKRENCVAEPPGTEAKPPGTEAEPPGTHTLDKNAAHAWHTCAISADHAKHAFVFRMTDVDRATRAHVISMLTMARIHSMMMLIRCGIRVV